MCSYLATLLTKLSFSELFFHQWQVVHSIAMENRLESGRLWFIILKAIVAVKKQMLKIKPSYYLLHSYY